MNKEELDIVRQEAIELVMRKTQRDHDKAVDLLERNNWDATEAICFFYESFDNQN